MEFQELIEKRYSVRSFKNEHLPKDVLDRILKAGHLAPTGCNMQPQRILVLNTDSDMEKVENCTRCRFGAPTALLITYDKTACWQRKYDGALSGEIDASIVNTHMMLKATELGVGCTWVMHFNPVKTIEAFRIPENLVPVAFLMMGYPAEDATPGPMHSEFKPLEETVFYGSF